MSQTGRMEMAHAATEAIMVEVDQVRRRLAGPWLANGFGVFTDPRGVQADLRASIDNMTRALSKAEAVIWPAEADYEDL